MGFLEDAVSRAFLEGEGLRFSSHSAVVSEFGRLFAKTGRVPSHFHQYLKEGQEDRHAADYHRVYLVTQEEAEEQVGNAERFLKLAEERIGRVEPG